MAYSAGLLPYTNMPFLNGSVTINTLMGPCDWAAAVPTATLTAQTIFWVEVESAHFAPAFLQVDRGAIVRFNTSQQACNLTHSSMPLAPESGNSTRSPIYQSSNGSGQVDYQVVSDEPQWFYCDTWQESWCDIDNVFALDVYKKSNFSSVQPSISSNGLNISVTTSSFQVTSFLASLSSNGMIGPSSIVITPAIVNQASASDQGIWLLQNLLYFGLLGFVGLAVA